MTNPNYQPTYNNQGANQGPYAQSPYQQPYNPYQQGYNPYQQYPQQGNAAPQQGYNNQYQNSSPRYENPQPVQSTTPPPQQTNTTTTSSPPTADYNYDPYHINYSEMSVNQFNSVPNEQTNYSQYWDGSEAFQPQNFEENTKKENKWNDIVFLIIFWVHFLVSVALLVWLVISSPKAKDKYSNVDVEIDKEGMTLLWKSLAIGIAISVILNVLHFFYITFAPSFYIKWGFIIGIVIAIILTVAAIVFSQSFVLVIFPIIWILLSLCMYCMFRKYIPFSASVLDMTCKLIVRFPSVIFVEFMQMIINIGVSIFFSAIVFYIQYRRFSNFIYIWVILSYYWTSLTIEYVTYMTCAGLAASWYFLNGTEYMPKNPCLQSFKRAITTSFGSACLAGLLLAIIQTLKALVNMGDSGGSNGVVSMIICLLRCIAMCVLNILECCLSFIIRYALIYCAIFGVPFKEACRRFAELQCNRFIDALIGGCMIGNALSYNMLTFSVGSAILGYGLGYWAFGKDTIIGCIFTCIFALIFTLCIFMVFESPVETISDTIFVCFAESPEQLKTTANELYELFVDKYNVNLKHLANQSSD